MCPRIGLTATPKKAILDKNTKDITEEDLEILDTYKLFGCEQGEPDFQFDLARGIDEGFLAPYKVLEIKTYPTREAEEKGLSLIMYLILMREKRLNWTRQKRLNLNNLKENIYQKKGQ